MQITRDFVGSLRERLSERSNFIQVVLGPRQVGKTTGVKQIFDSYPGGKVMASADLLVPPSGEWIVEHWNKALEKTGDVLLVLDEIQKVPRWSEVVKSLFDKVRDARRLKIVLLGSASLSLSTGLHDSLAGRFEKISVPHWDYAECQRAFSWTLEQFLMFGGYPAAAELATDPNRWQQFMRDSIIEPIVSRDIFGLASIRRPALFRQVFELAMSYPAQEVSYQKFLGQLQDPGNLATIRHYLEIMEQTFLLRLVPKYAGGVIQRRSSSPKLIPLCPALSHAFVSPEILASDPTWHGRVFELAIGAALHRQYPNLYYWRDKNAELDFVITQGKKLYAIEVKSGRVRKKSGLHLFLRKYPSAIPKTLDRESGEKFLRGQPLEMLG